MIFSLPTNNFRYFIIMHLRITILLCVWIQGLYIFYGLCGTARNQTGITVQSFKAFLCSRKCSKNQELRINMFFCFVFSSTVNVYGPSWHSSSSNSRAFCMGRKMLIILRFCYFVHINYLRFNRVLQCWTNSALFTLKASFFKNIDFYICWEKKTNNSIMIRKQKKWFQCLVSILWKFDSFFTFIIPLLFFYASDSPYYYQH